MPAPYKNPTCKGSFLLGSACGHCERCQDERSQRASIGQNVPDTASATDLSTAISYLEDYLRNRPMLPHSAQRAFQMVLDAAKSQPMIVLSETTQEVAGMAAKALEENQLQRMKILRVMNLLGDIIHQASNDPAKLTGFNSPLLQLAAIEIWNHNNPDQPVDNQTTQIYTQLALVGYNG